MNDSIRGQGARFVLIGAANTLIGNATFFLALHWGMAHQFALILAYLTGGSHGYLWNRRWTFQATGSHVRQVPRYVVVTAAVYAVNAILLEGLVRLHLDARPAQIVCLVFTTLVSFVGHRQFSFRRVRLQGASPSEPETPPVPSL